MARKRIGARILRVVRGAMARKIDRDQPEALAERPIELTREDPRRRGIAVDEHHGWTSASRFVSGERTIWRVDFPRLHRPPPQGNSNASTGTAVYRGGSPPLSPFRKWIELKTCNIHKWISRTGRVGPFGPPRTLPPIALPFRRPFVY